MIRIETVDDLKLFVYGVISGAAAVCVVDLDDDTLETAANELTHKLLTREDNSDEEANRLVAETLLGLGLGYKNAN